MGTCSNGKELQEGGESASPLEGSWKLQRIEKAGKEPQQPDHPTFLQFTSDSTFAMDLKVNRCQGGLAYPEGQEIRFKDPICTEMCCDTDLQKNLVRLLAELDRYTIEEERLMLKGDSVELHWEKGEPREH